MKPNEDKTVPFNTIPMRVLKDARDKLHEISGGDLSRVDPDMIVTVLKSTIRAGSVICAVPRKIDTDWGVTFRIPLRNSPHPAFASRQQILGI